MVELFNSLESVVHSRSRFRQSWGNLYLLILLEPLQSLMVPGQFYEQELQCHGGQLPGVFRLVDHTHASANQLLDDPIMRNSFVKYEDQYRQ